MSKARDWHALAEAVRERRLELGMTQEDVRHAGGPSTATMRLIEGGLQDNFQPAILMRLETALRWKRGSVRAILAGGEPAPRDEEAPAAPASAPLAVPITEAASIRQAPVDTSGVTRQLFIAVDAVLIERTARIQAEIEQGRFEPQPGILAEAEAKILATTWPADRKAKEIVRLRAALGEVAPDAWRRAQ